MAAITTRLLHLRPIIRPHPYILHHFSSSSDQPESERESESASETSQNQNKSSFSSYFSDVKSSLQREPPPQNRLRRPHSFPNPTAPPQTLPPPSKLASLEEIRRNLSEYRLRSAPPPPSSASSGQHVSFQEIFKRNILPNPGDSSTVGQPSLASVGERMRQLRAADPNQNGTASRPLDFSRLKEGLKLGKLEGRNDSASFAWNSKKESDENAAGAMRGVFFRSYKQPELGKQLQMLRPEKRKGNWFSLQELNDRLVRLREIEEESQKKLGGVGISDLRESLKKVLYSDNEKKRVNTVQRLDALSNLGATPSYMLYPPKEELVEQYFHPDNMSSAEKLKLELKKVRDEFKMSESDCGSARVQVAQLTTKIKHLSTVLAKKDKHSRKGLQAMVQKRKKLLKYLRRTDWDSYSLVLSKLGLRDNPDIKA